MKIATKPNGYTKRYKRSSGPLGTLKPLQPRILDPISSPTRTKLPLLSQDSKMSQSISPAKGIFKKNTIINVIDEKSNDYEMAIKAHLGIKSLSRDSSFREISQKPKASLLQKPHKNIKSVDYGLEHDLAAIEAQESKLSNSIKNLEKSKKKSLKPKVPNNLKTIDKEDKEIKLIQDSLNKINSLLNKLLNKSPNKHK
ncbi:hypothetical protein SteCoe_13716 [Stentor coeruleus]|uniref:Uncharacterized protein n=1 Tax=Stentor coeruleus TaxID=5963 RepID=A0A1R2C7U5_9CILI|nr:hypothetical protein SteCoe_13716 [Stentor coeruleus]